MTNEELQQFNEAMNQVNNNYKDDDRFDNRNKAIKSVMQDFFNKIPEFDNDKQVKQSPRLISDEELLNIQKEKSKPILLTYCNSNTEDRYSILQTKIEYARTTDFVVVSKWNNKLVLRYYEERNKIIDSYFTASPNENDKKHLLDLFERYNEDIKLLLGL